MALTAQRLDEERDELLARYRRALLRYGAGDDGHLPPGQDLRTCAHCGEHTRFRLDPDGTWFQCMACGQYA